MGFRASVELEPYEVERVDTRRQEAHQGKWAMGSISGKLAIQEAVKLVEDDVEDWG